MQVICGVDISKARLDVFVEREGDVVAAFANDTLGISALADFCTQHGVTLVVMEASGGFERLSYGLLFAAGIACALVHPAHVRHYAKAMGVLEKSDRIDARMIAAFAKARGVVAGEAPQPRQTRLKALVTRLSQLTGDLTVQKQRLSVTEDAVARDSLQRMIAVLNVEARRFEGEVASMIDDDPLWAKLGATFTSIKGVAGRTVARLMADLPEIGLVSNKAIAKLAGLAPIVDESGTRQGNRHISGGRAQVRSILYLVANLARKWDASLADFHRRLSAAGKPKMVIRIALARKLLVRLNAKARDARREFANAT
jgi:transposase